MTRPGPVRAFIGLGSNLGDRARHLGDARAALIDRQDLRIVSCSATIETDPVDVTDQPRFLNQVLGVETELEPRALLEVCLAVERGLGRDRARTPRRGPRTIDLDILVYDARGVDEDGLTIPHARLAERQFLLELCRQAGVPPEWLPAERRG